MLFSSSAFVTSNTNLILNCYRIPSTSFIEKQRASHQIRLISHKTFHILNKNSLMQKVKSQIQYPLLPVTPTRVYILPTTVSI
mmetsp:Transcript_22274/g.48362  ORF Transcript_22274/g.48362 Transcript_22274/m.48362 type:complete len:83 (+) Transcript_22274:53-301(+)